MKRIPLVVLLISGLFLTGCSSFLFYMAIDNLRMTQKEDVFSYVNANYETLESIPFADIPQMQLAQDGYHYEYHDAEGRSIDQARSDFIDMYLGPYTIVESIYIDSASIVEFSCHGRGLATNSIYVGFYFSRDDIPYAVVFENVALTETDVGVFEWQDENGSHEIYTERIRDNWFYYWVKY